jgi:pimeloyl-ACP methyl ester carboxylesterase
MRPRLALSILILLTTFCYAEHPSLPSSFQSKTEAKDIRAVVTTLGFDKTSVVAHDIGNMVAYAYAAMYPDRVDRLVVMDAPIPGLQVVRVFG